MLLLLALLAVPPATDVAPVRTCGWLWDRGSVTEHQPYQPQEGDLLFFTCRTPLYVIPFTLSRTGHPYHAALLVRLRSGEVVAFEAGGDRVGKVTLRHLEERFPTYLRRNATSKPAIWVRTRKEPLSPEASARLTEFAESQVEKKLISLPRFVMIGLYPLIRFRTNPRQHAWFCSELAVATLIHAGLLSADLEPAAIRPRDLYFGISPDLSSGWDQPRRWTPHPCPPPPAPWLAPG